MATINQTNDTSRVTPDSDNRATIWVIAAIAVLALIAVIAYAMYNPNNYDTQSAGTTYESTHTGTEAGTAGTTDRPVSEQ